MDWEPLLEAARTARENAYAPYSGFQVGSALAAGNGEIYAGANVENATYGLTICAERSAIASAVVEGVRQVTAVAVVTAASPPSPPCGPCLQSLAEFAGPDLPILLANLEGERRELCLRDLFPDPFKLP